MAKKAPHKTMYQKDTPPPPPASTDEHEFYKRHLFCSIAYTIAMKQRTLLCIPPPQNCRGWAHFFV